MLEIHECVARPQLGLQLLAGDEDAGVREEEFEQAEGLLGDGDPLSVPAQFTGVAVENELAERHA